MTTRELLKKLPENVLWNIERLRKDYTTSTFHVAQVRAEIYGYVRGLTDAGLINENERRLLYCYATV